MEKITKDFVVLVQLKIPFESDRYFQPSNIITKKCAIKIKLTFNKHILIQLSELLVPSFNY